MAGLAPPPPGPPPLLGPTLSGPPLQAAACPGPGGARDRPDPSVRLPGLGGAGAGEGGLRGARQAAGGARSCSRAAEVTSVSGCLVSWCPGTTA